ncbi:MAG: PD-(D/E)XK nuclease family transposase [Bacteroidota bacterium]|nr:PD-(D/E)XK nuclease family transposase [Bacteroidota bacterium]
MGKHIRFDWAMKRLLRQKSNFGILEGFLSELLLQDIKILEILDSETNKLREDDKFNRVDILVKSTKDELMLVEVQNNREHDYFHRMNYGQAKLTTEHINEGDKSDKIKKVFSINIVYFELGQGDDYIYKGKTEFTGIHKNDKLQLSNKQKEEYQNIKEVSDIFATYYIIKVNNFDGIAKNTLDEWIYFLKNSEIKKDFKAKGLSEAKEKMRTDNLEGDDKYNYDAYIKEQRIRTSEIDTAIFDAKNEVEEKLLPIIQKKDSELQKKDNELQKKDSEIQQKENEFDNLILNMKKKGYSNKEIAEITGKKIKEIEGL